MGKPPRSDGLVVRALQLLQEAPLTERPHAGSAWPYRSCLDSSGIVRESDAELIAAAIMPRMWYFFSLIPPKAWKFVPFGIFVLAGLGVAIDLHHKPPLPEVGLADRILSFVWVAAWPSIFWALWVFLLWPASAGDEQAGRLMILFRASTLASHRVR